MKVKSILVTLSLCCMVGGCTQSSMEPESKNVEASISAMKVTLPDALNKAEKLLAHMEGKTRAGSARLVKSVSVIGAKNTRSDDADTAFYVVNYANGNGFAVLGADKRLDGVYAIAGEGELKLEDTTTNIGLNLYFRYLDCLADFAISRPSIDYDSLPAVDMDIYQDPVNHSYKRGPYINRNVSFWGQDEPFNYYCPEKKNSDGIMKKCKTGCVATACAMIMSYYEYPSQYNGYSFNWPLIKNEGHLFYTTGSLMIARLIRELGNSDNLNMNYGIESSGANRDNVKRTFKHLGYASCGSYQKFTYDTAYEFMLHNSKPFLISAKIEGGRHSWVCDGIYVDMWEDQMGSYGEGVFFHMIWGWGGYENGYFKYGTGFRQSKKFKEDWDYFWNAYENASDIHFCGDISPN